MAQSRRDRRSRPAATPPIPRLTAVTTPEAAEVGERDADDAQARLLLRRGRIVTASVAAALVVLVGVVALFGGFRARTDQLTTVPAGTLIATGPYEVTLDKATVRHVTSSDEWEVVASGTARTTGATSITPGTDDAGFVFARAAAGGPVEPTTSVALGETDAVVHLDHLTPGLPPVPWSVSFRFPREPADPVLLAVYDQQYTTPYLFSKELGWRPTRSASVITLSLGRLPDEEF